MTLKEVRREVDKDYPILARKVSYVVKKLLRKLRPKREQMYDLYYDYLSKYKNRWIYRIQLRKRNTQFTGMVYFEGRKGLTAIQPLERDHLMFYTGHFFRRYNERRRLGLVQPDDIMKAFMADNGRFRFKNLEEKRKGIYEVFGVTQSGVILGLYHKRHKVYRANTFIRADMLMGEQIDLYNRMIQGLEE